MKIKTQPINGTGKGSCIQNTEKGTESRSLRDTLRECYLRSRFSVVSNDSAVLTMPNEDESLEWRLLWLMGSKAAERSSRIRVEVC